MPPPPSDIKQPDRKLKARGLTVYISDIRNCASREQEEERVFEELANIRAKFSQQKSNKPLSSYDRRKYVWKLVYTHLLGYDVDFGHMQAIELLAGTSFPEKLCGYLALSVLLRGSDEIMTLVINTIKRDLAMVNQDPVQCLALCAIANIGGRDMAHALADDVRRLALNEYVSPFARKKAVLALLRIHRETPEVVRLPSELDVVQTALEPVAPSSSNVQLGLALCSCALLKHMIERSNAAGELGQSEEEMDADERKERALRIRQRPQVQAIVVRALHRLAVYRTCPDDYIYHGTAAPFLQVALVRCLRAMGSPPAAAEIREPLFEAVRSALANVKWSKSSTINNASRCVAFEAIALIVQYPVAVVRPDMVDACTELLGKFVSSKNANTRYLALGSMTHIARAVSARYSSHKEAATDRWQRALGHQQDAIVQSLKDVDTSVRKRALDLLFHVCDEANAQAVIGELLNHLRSSAEDLQPEFKREMVLRIAVLAERYSRTSEEYIDLAARLLEAGDEYVGEDVWHRVAQVISNQEDVQQYAALHMYRALLSPRHVPPSLVKVSAYVTGEFGYLLTEYSTLEKGDLDHDVLALDLFGACHKHFAGADSATKIVLLSSYSKLLNIYEDLEAPVEEVFEQQMRSIDCEIQQRACEYLFLARVQNKETMHRVLEPMPPWPDVSRNKLEEELERLSSSAASSPRPTQARKSPAAPEAKSPATSSSKSPASSSSASNKDSPSMRSSVKRKAPPEPLVDLGHDDRDSRRQGGPPPPRPAPNSPSAILLAQTRKLHLNALLTPKSLLFDDGVCQIGSHQRFARGEASVELFVGNLSTVKALESAYFETANPEPDALMMRIPEGANRMDRFTVPPSAQVKFPYVFRCTRPFATPPELILVDALTQHHLARVRFPLALTCFLEPFPMPAPVFQAKWVQLEASASLCAENSAPPRCLLGSPAFMSSLAKCAKLFDLLHLFRLPDWPVEQGGETDLAGAGVLVLADSPAPVGVLLRIQITDTLVRVGVRATLPEAAQILLHVIAQQVSRLFSDEA